jgi:hypothetical protein
MNMNFSFMNRMLALGLLAGLLSTGINIRAQAIRVEVVKAGDSWQLNRDGKPFFIKGAGGDASLALLKEAGGNSIRTWGADNLQPVLDNAQKLGLTVAVGIWFQHEGDGFNYSNPEMVKKQLDMVRTVVTKYKDHPAVLLWGLGNEMEGYGAGDKAEIWTAVNDAAKLVKQIDPNHPTMTVLSELGGERVTSVNRYCPDVDIVGINSYAGASSVADRYLKLNGTKPYLVTEYGSPGPWEIGKTSWGAAYEPTSTEKGDWYRRAYAGSISQKPLCLGAYAFLWGQKQETTVTWFGMFLKDGTKVQAVDTMTELWTGQPPANPCPVIKSLKIRGKDELTPSATFTADLAAADLKGQPLQVNWVIQPEQTIKGMGGSAEPVLAELNSAITQSDATHAEVKTPAQPGGYRLFAYVRNNAGAAVANVPFYVGAGDNDAAGKPATLPFYIYEDQGSAKNHYIPSGWMGNTKAIKMDDGCMIRPHGGTTCLRVEYQATTDWGGVVWQDPANDWGDQVGGWNLTGAKQLTFWARGDKGGEVVSFKFGLLGKDKPHNDSANGGLDNVTLTKEWKQYSIDLTDKNMSRIKTAFAWTTAGTTDPSMFYLDDIRFE